MGSNRIQSQPLGYVSCQARASTHASSHIGSGGNTYTHTYTNTTRRWSWGQRLPQHLLPHANAYARSVRTVASAAGYVCAMSTELIEDAYNAWDGRDTVLGKWEFEWPDGVAEIRTMGNTASGHWTAERRPSMRWTTCALLV